MTKHFEEYTRGISSNLIENDEITEKGEFSIAIFNGKEKRNLTTSNQ